MARQLITFIILFLFASIQLVMANPNCGKNAGVSFTINSDDGSQTCGDMVITSGKDSSTFPTNISMQSLRDCAFHNYECTGTWEGDRWNYCCNKANDRTVGMHGSGNVEFSCSDGPYTCNDFKW